MLQKIIKAIVKVIGFNFSESEKLQGISMRLSNLKIKIKEDLYKASFYILVVSAVTLTITNTAYFFMKRSSNTHYGIEVGQIALVNLESDAIVVGKVIQDQIKQAKKQEAVDKIEEKFDIDKVKEKKEQAKTEDKIFKAKVNDGDLKKSKVALIVRDLGLSKSLTLNTLDMTNKLTLGFTPYSMDVANWVDQAVSKGFEVLINIPMQPTDYPVNDPGPYAMINNLSKGENVSRFNWIAMRSEKIAGYYTNEDETFTNSRSNFAPILERVKEGGRYLVFGNKSNTNGAQSISDGIKLNFKPINNIIDTVLEEEKIRNKLLLLEAEAMRKGYAIGFLNPYPISLRVVEKWMKEIDGSKLVVVPVSAIFKAIEDDAPAKRLKGELRKKSENKKLQVKSQTDAHQKPAEDSHESHGH